MTCPISRKTNERGIKNVFADHTSCYYRTIAYRIELKGIRKMDWKSTVASAINGDAEAWSLIFEKTQSMVYFTCVKLLHNVDAAEDIAQDVYVSAMKNIGALTEPDAFPGWIKRIAVNLSKNYLVKNKPMLFSEDEEDNAFANIPEVNEDFLPEEYAQKQETCRIITGMIDKLPEKQRICVMLYYYDELSVAEIANMMQVSENTVKSRLNYARSAIKKEVESLEKKGTKLYGVGLPVLALILRNASTEYALSAKAAAAITATLSGTAAAATAATTTTATSVATASSAATAGTSAATAATIAAKAAIPLGVKIAAGIVAASVAIGGIAVGVTSLEDDDDDYRSGKHSYTDESDDHEDDALKKANEKVRAEFAKLFPFWTDGGQPGVSAFFADLTHDGIDEMVSISVNSPDGEFKVYGADNIEEHFFYDYSQEMSNWRYVHYLVFIEGKAHIMRSGWFGRQGYPLHFYEIFYLDKNGEKIIVKEETYEGEEATEKEVETNKKIEEYHKNGFIILGFPDGDIGFGDWTQDQLDAFVAENKNK